MFVHKQTGQLHPNTQSLLEQVAKRIEQSGVEAWFSLDSVELLGEQAADYDKVQDILDVWFDSGVTHSAVLQRRDELHYPADLYLEGSDQHRGWFQTSLLSSVAMHQTAPFRQVLTHGFTIDGEGRKMSKSLGNVISADTAMKTMGADILRLWIASADYRAEIAFSDEIFNRIADVYRRLRNTLRFLLANLHDFDPAQHLLPISELVALDHWAVNQAQALNIAVQQAYDTYQFHQVYQKLQHFCSIDLGSFYLDIIKDRQYTAKTTSRARRSAQTAIFHIAEVLVRSMAPILSFTAEEVWSYLPGNRTESVFLSEPYTVLAEQHAEPVMTAAYWDKIRKVRELVNKELEQKRSSGQIGAGLEAEVKLYASDGLLQDLQKLQAELRFVLMTSTAEVLPLASETMFALDNGNLSIEITASKQPKCARCWHRRADVGEHEAHPDICGRCVENISGEGETRHYA